MNFIVPGGGKRQEVALRVCFFLLPQIIQDFGIIKQ